MGCLGTFAHLPPGLVLVKTGLPVQLDPYLTTRPSRGSHEIQIASSSKQAAAEGLSQVVSYICLLQNCSQEAQNQHTQWPASDNISGGSNKIHKQHSQREISAGTKPCGGKFSFMWSAPAQQLHIMVGVESHIKPA